MNNERVGFAGLANAFSQTVFKTLCFLFIVAETRSGPLRGRNSRTLATWGRPIDRLARTRIADRPLYRLASAVECVRSRRHSPAL